MRKKYKFQWQIDMEKMEQRLAEEHEKNKFQWQMDREEMEKNIRKNHSWI